MDELARDVMNLSRNTLLVNLRFLDAALSQFQYVSTPEISLATDGQHLLYSPVQILISYKEDKARPVRDYLHVVLHCIFQHMYVDPKLDRNIWDLAVDIAVEAAINELDLKATASSRGERGREKIAKIKEKVGMLTAEKIYRYYLDQNLNETQIAAVRSDFEADDHRIWYMEPEELEQYLPGSGQQGSGNGDPSSENEPNSQGGSAADDAAQSIQAQAGIWKEISERMQMDLETFSKSRGDTASNLIQNLKEVNREKYDYSAFIRKFAVPGEVMRVNEDEFDYIFYTYGLKLYGKMPLIESLEYKEMKRIREFVIAIDTSGSASGELVQTFIKKTYNILKSTESFFARINLHIIQCDAAIQEHVKITSQDEFDVYLKNMKLHGFGGTDFRPVFSLVDELIQNKEFTNLKGLIYFTDGYGVFPERKPDYDTAFVFINEGYDPPEVPPWAIRLVLQKEDV